MNKDSSSSSDTSHPMVILTYDAEYILLLFARCYMHSEWTNTKSVSITCQLMSTHVTLQHHTLIDDFSQHLHPAPGFTFINIRAKELIEQNQPQSIYKHSLTFRVRRYTHLQCIKL